MKTLQIPRRFVAHHWGGTETAVLETSRQLLANGHATQILTTNALASSAQDNIDGVPIDRAPYFYPYFGLTSSARRRLDHQGGNLFSFSLFRRLWQHKDLDLFHLHTGKRLGGIVRTVARQRNLPYVVSLHGGFLHVPEAESKRYTAPTQGALEWGKALGWIVGSRRVLHDAAAIICVSTEEQRKLQQLHPTKRIHYLPNGVDTKRFSSHPPSADHFRAHFKIPNDRFLLTVIGRIDPQKNQLLAIQLLHQLRRLRLPVHLGLVGATTDEAYHQFLLDTVDRLQLQAHVTFTGNLDTAPPSISSAYQAADLLLVPSLHEPFGIVALEAWASQTPILASKLGGLAELITDHHTGLLFEPQDLDTLVTIASRLIQSPEELNFLRRQGWQAVQHYRWSAITDRLLHIYYEVHAAHHTSQKRAHSC